MTSRPAKKCRLFSLVLVSALFFFQAPASASTISFEEYRSRLDQALESVKSGQGAMKPEEVTGSKGLFPTGLHVRTGKGAEVKLNREDLIRRMEEAGRSSEAREALARHIESVIRQMDRDRAILPWADEQWEQSRTKLHAIYQLNEFQGLRERQTPRWPASLIELFEKLKRWLGAAFKAIEGKVPGQWIAYVLYGFLLAAAGFVVFWIIRNFGPAGWRRRGPSARTITSAKPVEADWRGWRQKAMEKASGGAFREAIRFFFVSVLLEGHHHGWWTYNPEATNREHLARVGGPMERRDALNRLIALYERVWYGQEAAGPESFRHCSEWLKRMEAAL